MKKRVKIAGIILIALVVILLGSWAFFSMSGLFKASPIGVYRLVKIGAGNQLPDSAYLTSSGLYEANLSFINVKTNYTYSVLECTQNFSWVKGEGCYRINTSDVTENIQSHNTSIEIKGCYTGEFAQMECNVSL